MKQRPPLLISDRRLARLIAWAGLVLAWAGMMLFGEETQAPNRRYIRQRFHWLSLDRLARLVAKLVLMRAAQILKTPRPAPRRRGWRDYTGAGFARRTTPRQLRRSVIGVALRRALKHRDPRTRFAILLATLRNLDPLARKLARRLGRRLTRLFAIVATQPPQHAARSLALTPIAQADTS